MPSHGPPGDPHGTGQAGPFGNLLRQLAPTIGSAIGGFNTATQPIRDNFNRALGLVSENTTEILGGLGGAGLFAKGAQELGNFSPEFSRAMPEFLRNALGVTRQFSPDEIQNYKDLLAQGNRLQRSQVPQEIARSTPSLNLPPRTRQVLQQAGRASAGGGLGVLANQLRGFGQQALTAAGNFRPPSLMPMLFYLSPQMREMFERGAEKRTS